MEESPPFHDDQWLPTLDFIITGRTKELLEREIKPLVEQFLHTRGLELSPDKTVITHIKDGFDFLGQNVRKYRNRKLLIKPSRKSIRVFLEGVRGIIRDSQSLTAAELIGRLNPRIQGWANYHRHVVSKQAKSSFRWMTPSSGHYGNGHAEDITRKRVTGSCASILDDSEIVRGGSLGRKAR